MSNFFATLLITTFVVFVVLTMSGCQSKATSARFDAAQQFMFACQTQAMQIQAQPKQASTYTDPRDQLLALAIEKMSQPAQTPMESCDDFYIAMINGDTKKMQAMINGGFGLAKAGLVLWGVDILAGGITDLAGSGSDSYQFRDVNMTNNAGAGGLAEGAGAGGSAVMNFNAGGDLNNLDNGSSIIQAEKFQDNTGNAGGPILDDSGDGGNNEAGIGAF